MVECATAPWKATIDNETANKRKGKATGRTPSDLRGSHANGCTGVARLTFVIRRPSQSSVVGRVPDFGHPDRSHLMTRLAGTMDDDRTVIRPLPEAHGRLPVGYRLQEFVVEGIQGEGGFSIVYRARDLQLQRDVALKEYLPSALAMRATGASVVPRSQRHEETFQLGLRSFINEARLLASFDHPALVKVYRFWEANGTAYMVMPLYRGPTLKAWLAAHEPPSEAWLKRLLAPLLDALELMHREQCFHRDIAPDNVLLLDTEVNTPESDDDLKPVLLDFGAARRVIGDADHQLTVILKPGYAPIEQYGESTGLRQGPWTDVYALCAMLYGAIAAKPPTPSIGRPGAWALHPTVPRGRGPGSGRQARRPHAVGRSTATRPLRVACVEGFTGTA
jgi:serine/threonine protein kinase